MRVEVEKYTSIEALHTANSFTTGHESKMSLRKAYSLMHSPIRTQRFYVYMEDIPLFCASQFVRSTQGVQWYQRSKRPDRGGLDFNDECRNLGFGIRTNFIGKEDWSIIDLGGDYGRFADAVETLPEKYDRYAPTSLMGDMNAEAIINMSKKRLCAKASQETREIWAQVIVEVAKADSELALFCVKPCVFSGGICREHKSCGFNKTELFNKQLNEYKKLFI